MHIEGQFELADMVLDTWPTERKHKVFKADLAPRIKHLQEFEKSVLMPWVEHDLDVLIREYFQQRLLQPLKKQDTPGLQFGKAIQTERGNTFRIGNVILFKKTDAWQAYEVASCFSYASGLGVVEQQMDLIKDSPHMSWSEWKLKDRYIIVVSEQPFAPNMRMAASCCCDKKRGLQLCSGANRLFKRLKNRWALFHC